MTRTIAVPFILPLESEQATLDRAGGKGMNLSELARAGFEVPAGFIVTTNAYRDFVAANGLQEQIVTTALSIKPESPESLEAVSAQLRVLFDQASMPAQIESQIATAYRELEHEHSARCAVAVRSSATPGYRAFLNSASTQSLQT